MLSGIFTLKFFNHLNADELQKTLSIGDIVIIPPGILTKFIISQLTGTIIEFASADYEWDNYRIGKGDSQTKKKINLLYKTRYS